MSHVFDPKQCKRAFDDDDDDAVSLTAAMTRRDVIARLINVKEVNNLYIFCHTERTLFFSC